MNEDLIRQVDKLQQEVDGLIKPEIPSNNIIISAFQLIPGHMLWATQFDTSGNWLDFSQRGQDLTLNGNPTFNLDGEIPYAEFDGTGDFFEHADGADFDIIMTESYVGAASRGITMCGWAQTGEIASNTYLMSKWNNSASGSYTVRKLADNLQLAYRDGGGVNQTLNSTVDLAVDDWFFFCAKIDPSTIESIRVNNTVDTNAAGVGAALANSNLVFRVGDRPAGGSEWDGRVSICALAPVFITNALESYIFNRTRNFYGV